MSKTLRNVLTAAAVATLVGFLFGALGAAVNSPDLGSVGLTLAASIGGITFFILHLRSGNRCVAQADSDARARALAFGCPPDRALVFFVRSGFAGGAVGVDVAIDGKTLAQIKSPRFTCVQLAPGEHALSAHVGGSASALTRFGASIGGSGSWQRHCAAHRNSARLAQVSVGFRTLDARNGKGQVGQDRHGLASSVRGAVSIRQKASVFPIPTECEPWTVPLKPRVSATRTCWGIPNTKWSDSKPRRA